MENSCSAWVLALVLSFVLFGCSHSSTKDSLPLPSSQTSDGGRYPGKPNDWGPDKEIDMSHVPDAVPRYEQRTGAGNKNPYSVLGQTYYLIDDERSYKERGKASWYGYKFNGERTSNGEFYDMFSMTGAHKTLPIPSYVRVTNLANHNSVVVRINDRGPFHEERIIDLSYAAAQRLGITKMGTGDVEVEIVVPDDDPRPPLRPRTKVATYVNTPATKIAVKETENTSRDAGIVSRADEGITVSTAIPEGTYLQIGAFSIEKSAKQFAASVGSKLGFPVVISVAKAPQKLYRVRVGPFKDAQGLQNAREQLQKINILQAHVVYQ